MIRKAILSGRAAEGLRTRFFPKSRIGQGVISMAPWLNLVLLIAFFVLLDRKFVLQPGVVIRLPRAPFTDGTLQGMTVVALSVPSGAGEREEIVIFDDERFLVRKPERMIALREALESAARRRSADRLIVMADASVRHGTVATLVNMAEEAGLREINVAARDAAQPNGTRRGEPP
jgi:biopolymer transport protein ExbD